MIARLFMLTIPVALLVSVIIMVALIDDGESHWFKGAQLLGLFAIVVAAILYLT